VTSTHALTKVTTLNEDDVIKFNLDPLGSSVAQTERGIKFGQLLTRGITQAELDAEN